MRYILFCILFLCSTNISVFAQTTSKINEPSVDGNEDYSPEQIIENEEFLTVINPVLRALNTHLDNLYNLEDLLKHPLFLSAKNDTQRSYIMNKLWLTKRDHLILKIFKQKNEKFSARMIKDSLWDLGPIGMFIIAKYLSHSKKKGTETNKKKSFTRKDATGSIESLLVTPFILSCVTKGIERFNKIHLMTTALERVEQFGLQGIRVPEQEAQKIYVSHYHLMRKDPYLLHNVKTKLKEMHYAPLNVIELYKEYILIASSLPAKYKGTYFNKEVFAQKLQFFSKDTRKKLELIAKRHVIFNRSEVHNSFNFPIYFHGIPGSGKTYAANCLAQATDVLMASVILDGASIAEIVGTRTNPGRLLESLTKSAVDPNTGVAYKDSILFIDEFDRLLNAEDSASRAVLSFMLKLLDANQRKFFSPYLGLDVNLPKTIILAGNYDIKDPALRNRFEIMPFDGYDLKEQHIITFKHILPKICALYKVEQDSLTAQQHKDIIDIIEDSKNDRGLRNLEKNILIYVSQIAFAKFDQLITTPPKTTT